MSRDRDLFEETPGRVDIALAIPLRTSVGPGPATQQNLVARLPGRVSVARRKTRMQSVSPVLPEGIR